MKQFLLFFSLTIFPFILNAQCNETTFSGEGTYYDYAGGGNCSFPYFYTELLSAAMNEIQYGSAELCGACAEVTGPSGTIVVSIEDRCPECAFGDIDLSAEAFPYIADPILGRVAITWKIISCPVTGPVSFYFKEGSSQWWTAVQVRNHKNPIQKFEYLKNGVWTELPRQTYNYFEDAAGMGPGPYDFRITDINGNTLTETNIPLAVEQEVEGINQFPDCPGIPTYIDIPQSNLQIWPNPALNGKSKMLNKSAEPLSYSVTDLLGKEVESGTLAANTEKSVQMPQGEYIIKFTGESLSFIRRLIVLD